MAPLARRTVAGWLFLAAAGVLPGWVDAFAEPPPGEAHGAGRDHWAFRPPVRPPLPFDTLRAGSQVRQASWARSPVDAFILARLEKEGLKPSPEADRLTLLRRLYLDLIGLPPTLAEIDAFLADPAADAADRVVEQLLASPHYGERWGRQWLDAARYADSNGYEKDRAREMWHYRDWVVEAFNRDLPYDRFLLEQLAGDLLPGSDGAQDRLIATGFLRNSMLNEEGAIDPEQLDRKSTRLNSSHRPLSRMPSSA